MRFPKTTFWATILAVLAALPAAAQQVRTAAESPEALAARLELAAPATEHAGAAALGLNLRRLGHTKRVLMIAAHPDDEDTSVLATLALGDGAQVAYLSLTRGEGGQNGIGPELQESLGLIRSEELVAARRLDGAAQFFTRAYDFGYSRSLDETLAHWPRELLLEDVVAVVRAWRPDIVLSVFSGTARDGHGHHQAAGVMAREAFDAAGDPSRFPEQIAAGLAPHTPLKLYRSSWFRPEEATFRLPTGEYDPLLGRSHFQIAMASRSRHRSQDMGRLELPGPRAAQMQRLAARVGPEEPESEASIWEGIDYSLSGRAELLAEAADGAVSGSGRACAIPGLARAAVANTASAVAVAASGSGRPDPAPASGVAALGVARLLASYEARVAALREAFNPLHPERLIPDLVAGLAELREADAILAGLDCADARRLRFHLAVQTQEARAALARAAGLELDAVAAVERVVPGEPFELELTLWNGGPEPVDLRGLRPVLPPGWAAESTEADAASTSVAPGTATSITYRVLPAAAAASTEPYFLRSPRRGSLYAWPDTVLLGLPFESGPVQAEAIVAAAGTELRLERAAEHRALDPRRGELRTPVRVVPAVTVAVEPEVRVLPLAPAGATTATSVVATAGRGSDSPDRGPAIPLQVRVRAISADGARGTLHVAAPAGWRAEPGGVELDLASGEERRIEVRLHPTADAAPGSYRVAAHFAAADGRRFERGYRVVDYEHIRPRSIFGQAEAEIVAFDADITGARRIGYVLGVADRVPAGLSQLGLEVILLDEASLEAGELGGFDAIVVGPRAYEVREDLAAHNHRLLEYARAGGTLVVQYQQYEFVQGGYAPFPLTIARPHDRVTDHRSPVRVLQPGHPAFVAPNPISAADFEGWIQERGLYFAHEWDDAYTPLLELEDPGLDPVRGGLLVAPYGRGTYVYTGLAFFRQLPAGVPGAYRLFLNLLSL